LAGGIPEMRKSGPYILGTVPNVCPAQILGQSGHCPGQFGTRPKNDQMTSYCPYVWAKLAERQYLKIKMALS